MKYAIWMKYFKTCEVTSTTSNRSEGKQKNSQLLNLALQSTPNNICCWQHGAIWCKPCNKV